MKLSEIVWSNPERPKHKILGDPKYWWLRTARLDKISPDGKHRLGQTVIVAWWPDAKEYNISCGSRMGVLEFAVCIREYGCNVRYNEYGDF